jgi:hypothetical protein
VLCGRTLRCDTRAGPNSAGPITNLIYLPLSYA